MTNSPTIHDAADAMIAYIEHMGGGVTLVELQRVCAEMGMSTDDTLTWILSDAHPNVVIWAGMSDAFAAALEQMRQSGRVILAPTSYLTYLLDGAILDLPLVKRLPKNGYKRAHWLPVAFSLADDDAAMPHRRHTNP